MFAGFSPEMLTFFRQLKRNNQREWFQKNKSRYEELVLYPALELVREMEAPLQRISPCFRAVAKRSGGSVMRIYRDTRFSKDKTPYKLNLGIQFRHEQGKDVHAPGFYFHVDLDRVFFGAGIWRPDTASITRIRHLIDDEPTRWKRLIGSKKFKETFERQGERLKRPPRGFPADHPLIEDLKLKDHLAVATWDTEQLFDAEVTTRISQQMKASLPLMRFLCEALNLPC